MISARECSRIQSVVVPLDAGELDRARKDGLAARELEPPSPPMSDGTWITNERAR